MYILLECSSLNGSHLGIRGFARYLPNRSSNDATWGPRRLPKLVEVLNLSVLLNMPVYVDDRVRQLCRHISRRVSQLYQSPCYFDRVHTQIKV